MEKYFGGFPRHGKTTAAFSMPWKNFRPFFHTMEKWKARKQLVSAQDQFGAK